MITYGAKLDSTHLKKFLEHVFIENDKQEGPGTPICIWGSHGLGKTQIAKAFANERGWKFQDVPIAQFEEMGDLHGMPDKYDPTPNMPDSGDERTYFFPPHWVPKEEGPGLILLDDFNRADDRILRGIMQLLQNFELTSWELPKKWQIVCTANPEGGDYSVTPLDDAMLTRMIHVTLKFDAEEWATWAHSAGIDERCISFVRNFPEDITLKRTTPRTLEQFFRQIEGMDFQKEKEMIQILAQGTLDDVTVGKFLNFIENGFTRLIEPEEILNATDFTKIEKRLEGIVSDHPSSQSHASNLGPIATIWNRLFKYLSEPDYILEENHGINLCSFLKSQHIPKDLIAGFMLQISRHANQMIREVTTGDQELWRMLRDASSSP